MILGFIRKTIFNIFANCRGINSMKPYVIFIFFNF